MYIAFNAAHDPRQSPREYVDKYPLDRIAMPKNFIPDYPYKEEMGAGTGLRDEKLAPWPRTELAVKTHRQEYYALITHMDVQIKSNFLPVKLEPVPTSQLIGYDMVARKYIGRNQAYLLASAEKRAP